MSQVGEARFSVSVVRRPDLALAGLLDRPLVALLVYVAAFWAATMISHGSGGLVTDTVEPYAWGKELQLGYVKHPPFWSWVAYAWYAVLPTSDWAAYLLSALNAAIGLGCTYLIALRFVPERQAMAAILCLIATPIYFCLASRFNANTVLLSLWPATTLFALRSQESDRVADGVVTGLLAAACLLSKYNSALFLTALFFALPLRGSGAVWYSRSAISCYLVSVAAVAPHLIWLRAHNYLPFAYFQETTSRPFGVSLREALIFPFTSIGFFLPALLIYGIATRTNGRAWWQGLRSAWSADRAFVTVLLFGPIGLTLMACLARSATVKPLYIIPELFMAPIWLVMIPGIPFNATVFARIRRGCAHFLIFYLVAAPIVAGVGFAYAPSFASQPSPQVARLVTAEWHERYTSPLRFIGGDETYALGTTFYSPDHPSYLLGFDAKPFSEIGRRRTPSDLTLTPWVHAQDLARQGMAIICSMERRRTPTDCSELVRSWGFEEAEEVKSTVATSLLGFRGPDYQFRVFFVPPNPDAPAIPER
jgi:hypothetical protein